MADREILHTYRCQEFESHVYEGDVLFDVDKERKVATITFNRPDKLNCVTLGAVDYVGALVKRCESDEDVRVIVFKGNGPCFGVGADATEIGKYVGFGEAGQRKPSQRRRLVADRDTVYGVHSMEQTIFRSVKPTIVQAHSYCYGAHFQMAMAADLVVASEDALFVHPAWRYLGPMFNFPLLFETIGLKKAKELVLTCRPLTADEAEKCGMVNRVVPSDLLDETTEEFVSAITVRNMDGIAIGKGMLEQAMEARGYGVGGAIAWAGHGWLTNLRHEPGEFNFVKQRSDKGITGALDHLDHMVDPAFRMGKSRVETK